MSERKVVIVEYRPEWPMIYEKEKNLILKAVGTLIVAVEHVGSTAVRGLGAKPTIDIMAAVCSLEDARRCIEPLRSIGYEYQPQHEASIPERRFFRKGDPVREQHYHLHMVERTSDFWRQHLLFRDYLKDHPETAQEYHKLKKELASRYGSDREGYTEAKTSFIESVLAKARMRQSVMSDEQHSTGVKVANASSEDAEALVTIYSSPHLYHNREEASWFVKSFFDYHHIEVVKAGEKVIGAAFWNVVEEKHHGLTEIADLWIDEGFRRRGLGEMLLRTVIENMKQFFEKDSHTLREVLVITGDDNEAAKRLYQKVGFERVAVLTDLFAKGEKELVYVLTLNS